MWSDIPPLPSPDGSRSTAQPSASVWQAFWGWQTPRGYWGEPCSTSKAIPAPCMGHALRLSPRLHRLIWKSAEVTSAHSPHYRESYFQQGSAASSSSVPFLLIHPRAQALFQALLCPCASAAVGPGWAGRCMPGWKSPWECPAPVLEEPEECGQQCWRLRVSREDDGTRLKPSPHSNQCHKIPSSSLLHPLSPAPQKDPPCTFVHPLCTGPYAPFLGGCWGPHGRAVLQDNSAGIWGFGGCWRDRLGTAGSGCICKESPVYSYRNPRSSRLQPP